MTIKAVTGTKDILPSEIPKWNYIENIVKEIFSRYNYKEIRTPVFEETALFARGIGEETDIVGKEMYTFTDRGGTSLTLKPEMTASVVRAYIEHSLGAQSQLQKLFYISPMFRQERPQAGRFRQFHQFGAEAIGSSSPVLDAEMIQMAYGILKSLGLNDIQVKLNSLGVPASREEYKKILRQFLEPKKNELSEDSRRRLDTNILRIFDSKIESDQNALKDAPLLLDFLDQESKFDFGVVQNILKDSGINFQVDPALVRGLDYYTKTTFEIVSSKVGSQSSLCGGGRYDLLAEQLGGKPTPGVGFAAGMERILLACENENAFIPPAQNLDFYLITLERQFEMTVIHIASEMRNQGFSVDLDYLGRSVKAQMREANKLNAGFVIFIGGDEFEAGKVKMKNMKNSSEFVFDLQELNNIDEILKKTGQNV